MKSCSDPRIQGFIWAPLGPRCGRVWVREGKGEDPGTVGQRHFPAGQEDRGPRSLTSGGCESSSGPSQGFDPRSCPRPKPVEKPSQAGRWEQAAQTALAAAASTEPFPKRAAPWPLHRPSAVHTSRTHRSVIIRRGLGQSFCQAKGMTRDVAWFCPTTQSFHKRGH